MTNELLFTPEFQRQIAIGRQAREAEKPWPWPKNPDPQPAFDGEAHRQFMRGLG